MKQEQQTFFNYTVVYPDPSKNESREYKSEKQYNEAVEEAKKASTPDSQIKVEATKTQTFLVSTAETFDEILSVVPNQDVALGYFNYGLTLAQHNVKRDLMTDPDWQPVEGAYDLLADVQQPKEKRVADPLSASRKSLKALWEKMNPGAPLPTDDEINAVLAQFAGAASPAPTAA